ncbi:hypothetical protein [Dinoroseobacter sp. S76]|uniref:hypothetical protein n=1 Tax=Dinoroseobacter sp. S76 TaxID=3415124 RepID=UPI003C7B185D
MSAQKDIWDKLEIIGKLLFVPILVGMIGLFVGSYQQEAAQQDKEFELALSVASTPEFISTDPLIASARDWANETLRERLGEDIPQSVLAATQGDVIAAITPQTAFVAIQSGEITQEQIAKDPRFKNCPREPVSVLVSCVGAVLSFIEQPAQISRFDGGPVDFGNGVSVERFLTEF